MNKKKILLFIDWYLPGYKAGGPIRSCANLIEHLSNEFDFFVVTRDTDYMEASPYSSVKKNEWNKLPDGSTVFYISKGNLNASTLKKIIKDSNADIFYTNGIFSFYFSIVPLWVIDRKKNKMIVAVRGMLAPSALSIKPIKKKIFLFLSKLFGLFSNVIFQASNEEEKKQIDFYFSNSKIKVAPNLSRIILFDYPERIEKSAGAVRLLNVARIAPEKNLLFALEVLRKVKGRVVFDFFGPMYDNDYWQQCMRVISNLPPNISATYKGIAEAEHLFTLMKDYHFLFLPSRGENFGHIILEAMSAGMPVIISDKTPWRNLQENKVGWDIPLDNEKEYSDVIEKCVGMSTAEFEIYSNAARAFALEYIMDKEKIQLNRNLFS